MRRQPTADRTDGPTRRAAILLTGSSALAVAAPFSRADAESFPDRPMRIVMPFAAGGNGDAIARALAARMSEQLRVAVVVDNRAGAGGAVGAEFVARAPKDGYTIMVTSSSIALDPTTRPNLPYNARTDLVPITQITDAAAVVMVSNALPVTTLSEFITYAKGRPGHLNFGTPGAGSSLHLLAEYFCLAAGIRATHIPYRGAGPALTALAANEIQFVLDPILTSKPLAEGGRARALAVTTAQRAQSWPDLPTVQEGGVAGFNAGFWLGAFVPVGTPDQIIDSLNTNIRSAMESDGMRSWARSLGAEVVTQSVPAARAFFDAEIDRWAEIIRRTGFRVE